MVPNFDQFPQLLQLPVMWHQQYIEINIKPKYIVSKQTLIPFISESTYLDFYGIIRTIFMSDD